MSTLRIGQGWDLHRLVQDRDLIIGGVKIPSKMGEDGHSDGDVLLHAIIDALLGALALGDIGSHFPPSDIKWKDADSALLLEKVMEMAGEAGYHAVNLDCTVILQSVRLSPYREAIRKRISQLLGLSPDRVSVKAKTKEGVDAVGRGEAVEAQAIVLLEEADPGLWV